MKSLLSMNDWMKCALFAGMCLVPSISEAQTPNVGPNDSFAWNQDAPNLAAAQGYVYKYYLDGATTGSVFSGVTCAGTASPYTCQVKSPTFSMGPHGIALSAASSAGESTLSNSFGFVYGNPPSIPNNIRVVKAVP